MRDLFLHFYRCRMTVDLLVMNMTKEREKESSNFVVQV